ncbi:DNA-binding transcriptional regulator, LysR family [Tardiphaga sp. OK246]|jgi:DNA-binding transcriptional LysR family regulator|uniref:LysR family transcriptional regulator n=1 Tax=Tardiphaga sp. OK246 TaxID=1855307 RepID=UPI000B651226|nr:LysR family transcriptional regulator [Tardiphaga sp. OK246]SNT56428.1 DNA-binding transcriptional regulator, LysR family [Tardiphaga sp. OK246]
MQSFDPISLRLFIAVCEERNIANAAKREAIVPSAVSKRISQMEQEAGVQLLERGRRGVTVTAAGEALCRYARESLQLLDRMQAELGAFADGVQGHVRVFASKSAVAQVLPEDISLFAKRYRDVRVSLEEREIWEVVRGVEEGRADIGVCWDAVDLRGLRTSPYHRDQLAVVVHPDHPLAKRTSVSFEDTVDYEHVDIVARSIMQTMQRSVAAAAGKQMRYRIQVSTVDAAYRIVAAQLAVAIIPQEEASTIQQTLGLKVIPLSNDWARRQFVVAVRDKGLSRPAQLLLESLKESASE